LLTVILAAGYFTLLYFRQKKARIFDAGQLNKVDRRKLKKFQETCQREKNTMSSFQNIWACDIAITALAQKVSVL